MAIPYRLLHANHSRDRGGNQENRKEAFGNIRMNKTEIILFIPSHDVKNDRIGAIVHEHYEGCHREKDIQPPPIFCEARIFPSLHLNLIIDLTNPVILAVGMPNRNIEIER